MIHFLRCRPFFVSVVGLLPALVFPVVGSAQSADTSSTPAPQAAQIVSTVNFMNPVVASQQGNVITIDFDITNREGVQPQIKYGVLLVRNTDQGKTLIDEHVYDEMISLAAQDQVHKTITYHASADRAGEYVLYLNSKTVNGLPLGMVSVGTVELEKSADWISFIDPSMCFLTIQDEQGTPRYTSLQGVDITAEETLIAHCVVSAGQASQTIKPKFTTYHRSVYGAVVPDTGSSSADLTLAPGETKAVTFPLPKAIAPQSYDIRLALVDQSEKVISNSVVFHYVLRGPSGTIQNVVLDKDIYGAGDTAQVSVLWTASADAFPGSRSGQNTTLGHPSVDITLSDGTGTACAERISQDLVRDTKDIRATVPVSITHACQNPHVSVVLRDGSTILDSQTFALVSLVTTNDSLPQSTHRFSFVTLLIILGLSGVLGLALILYVKKHPTI